MTTNELIEKYGIGHNCLSDAYDIGYKQGKADTITKVFNAGFASGYEKGRADAIEEFANEVIKPSNYERFDFDDCLDSSDKANDFFKYVFSIAEQLKEENNG